MPQAYAHSCTFIFMFMSNNESWNALLKLRRALVLIIVTTKCQILRLKCTKIDFGWGLQRSPRPPSWI